MSPKCLLQASLKRKVTSDLDFADASFTQRCQCSSLATPMLNVAPCKSHRPQHGAYTMARLGRGESEDTYTSAPMPISVQQLAAAPVHLLAVFDGHSSKSVSTMAMEQLPQVLSQLLEQQLLQESQGGGTVDIDSVVPRALNTAFKQLDDLVQPLDNSGSTATAVVLTPQQVHMAWVGDSRAVLLGRGGRVLGFTQEHRATREDEQERVAAAGGTVLNNSGLRVMGILQCTRAIGDKDLQPYGVTPAPDVVSFPRTGHEEFLVLATDGLWDVMSNEEVYDYARKAVKKAEEHHARQPNSKGVCTGCLASGVAARALAHCARKQRGSRDDITVMLANLGGGVCTCLNPPAVLSLATSSKGSLLASSSTGGVRCGEDGSSSAAAVAALRASSLSGPAALGQDPPTSSGGTNGTSNPPQEQQQHSMHPPAKAHKQQPLQSLPAPQRTHQLQHQQQQGHRWRPGSAHTGLVLQPSVCPGPASATAASAHASGAQHTGSGHSILSDLALSSPFAMMLGGTVTEVELVAEVVGVPEQQTAGGSEVVSRGSAPPALVATALGSVAVAAGASGLRKRSLSVALGNSRSCGSAGVPQLGPMGSTEPPVVVLT